MANGTPGAPLGNQNATKSKLFYATLRKLITDDEMNLPEKKRRLYLAGSQLLRQAAAGEEWAIKELANRLDGKAVQGVQLTGEDGKSLNLFDAGALRHMDPTRIAQLKDLLKEAASE